MTKEEIIEEISNDDVLPYVEPWALKEIVEFVIQNSKPDFPSNLDEAAEEYAEDEMMSALAERAFKAGARWRDAQIPKLPDNLEEAAQHDAILTYKMPKDGDFEKANKTLEARIFHEIGFKAGSKWMAEQDQKDHELTIKDLKLLHTFLYAVKNNKQGAFTFTRLSDEQYQEVLKRFKEAKK